MQVGQHVFTILIFGLNPNPSWYLTAKKNLVRNMSSFNNRQTQCNGRVKTIKAHKPSMQQMENVRHSNQFCSFSNNFFQRTDEENYVPLAAKDSGWADLSFHDAITTNNHSQVSGDADDEVTIEIVEGENSRRQQTPMVLLFPNLSDVDLTRKTSPTDITKLLVGRKPNLKYLRGTKKTQFFQVSCYVHKYDFFVIDGLFYCRICLLL